MSHEPTSSATIILCFMGSMDVRGVNDEGVRVSTEVLVYFSLLLEGKEGFCFSFLHSSCVNVVFIIVRFVDFGEGIVLDHISGVKNEFERFTICLERCKRVGGREQTKRGNIGWGIDRVARLKNHGKLR